MRQFYLATAPGDPPDPGDVVVLDSDESHHLFTVLRGGRDQDLNLTDGLGHRFTARVLQVDRRRAEVEISSREEDLQELRAPRLVLACAVVKARRFEWALEKAVEVGAHAVVPLQTEHGVVEPGRGKVQRWQAIMKSALKQSARTWLPRLDPVMALDSFLAGAPGPLFFGAVPGESPGPVRPAQEIPQVPTPLPAQLAFLVGPEGGWSASERDQLVRSGGLPVQLGPHVLRTETAAVAGLQMLQTWRQSWLASAQPEG